MKSNQHRSLIFKQINQKRKESQNNWDKYKREMNLAETNFGLQIFGSLRICMYKVHIARSILQKYQKQY